MIPIFVISIPGSSRRPAMQKRMDDTGLSFEWWDAIDGRKKGPSEILGSDGRPAYSEARTRLALDGRAMNGAEVAVSETTFGLYRHCLKMGHRCVAILEDDAWPQSHLPAALVDIETLEWEGVVRLFYPIYSASNRWHRALRTLIRNFRRVLRKPGVQTPDVKPHSHRGDYTISESVLRLGGAVGYTITADAMRRVLEVAYPLRLPIDLYLQYREMHGVHSLHLSPSSVVVKQDEIPSEIELLEVEYLLRRSPRWSNVAGDRELTWRKALLRQSTLALCWFVGRNVFRRSRRVYQFWYDLVRIRRYL